MSVKLRTLLLVISVVMVLGCSKQPGQDEFADIERLPESERQTRFASYPVERQLDIFLFAQFNLSGKRDTYMRYLADGGEDKIAQIAARIDAEDRASFKADLIGVLEFIDLHCLCVHNDPKVMDVLIENDSNKNETDANDVQMSKDVYRKILDRMIQRKTVAGSGH